MSSLLFHLVHFDIWVLIELVPHGVLSIFSEGILKLLSSIFLGYTSTAYHRYSRSSCDLDNHALHQSPYLLQTCLNKVLSLPLKKVLALPITLFLSTCLSYHRLSPTHFVFVSPLSSASIPNDRLYYTLSHPG